jgi:hypothetical protein
VIADFEDVITLDKFSSPRFKLFFKLTRTESVHLIAGLVECKSPAADSYLRLNSNSTPRFAL